MLTLPKRSADRGTGRADQPHARNPRLPQHVAVQRPTESIKPTAARIIPHERTEEQPTVQYRIKARVFFVSVILFQHGVRVDGPSAQRELFL
jgi:hypothetical protein